MYNLILDPLETNDLLLGTLSSLEQNLKTEFEANQRRTAWSCKDDIRNGDETGIDCGGTYCSPCLMSTKEISVKTERISVFPNPAKNSLTIISEKEGIQSIQVFNALGKLVLTKQVDASNSVNLNISSLNTSVYYLQINLSSGTEVRKILVN